MANPQFIARAEGPGTRKTFFNKSSIQLIEFEHLFNSISYFCLTFNSHYITLNNIQEDL